MNQLFFYIFLRLRTPKLIFQIYDVVFLEANYKNKINAIYTYNTLIKLKYGFLNLYIHIHELKTPFEYSKLDYIRPFFNYKSRKIKN